jgi:transposase
VAQSGSATKNEQQKRISIRAIAEKLQVPKSTVEDVCQHAMKGASEQNVFLRQGKA